MVDDLDPASKTPVGSAEVFSTQQAPDATAALANDRLRKLLQAGRRLGSTLDPHEVYEWLVQLLQESMPLDGLIVSSYDPPTQEIRCQYAWIEGQRPDVEGFPPLKLGAEGEGMQSRVIRTGLPYLFGDVEQRVRNKGTYYEITPEGDSERMPSAPPEEKEYSCTRSAMMAPIALDGQVLGVVQVMSMVESAYSHADLELFEGMVLQMAAAARNAALYEKAQREVEERTKAQAAIEELNRRLQRAMAETHHRVKNNLQVLAALVDMQLTEVEPSVPQDALRKLGLQIRSLSTLHDLLTQAAKQDGEADAVSIRSALENLVLIVRATAGNRPIRLDVEDVNIPVRQSTSFVLLVNELISNAVKHGAGTITVCVKACDCNEAEAGPGQIELSVSDEGSGFGPSFDPGRAASTGLELIETLGRWDLEGAIRFESPESGGARVVVTFPRAEK